MTNSRNALAATLILSTSLLGSACGNPVRPPTPNVEKVGIVVGGRESNESMTFTLGDGTAWTRRIGQFRFKYRAEGDRTLFVAGTDQEGTYVYLIGNQQGLPPECKYALRYGGREWGDAIESHGLLWPKAPNFVGIEAGPSYGAEYPQNAGLCLDDHARVTSVYLAQPASNQPATSAST